MFLQAESGRSWKHPQFLRRVLCVSPATGPFLASLPLMCFAARDPAVDPTVAELLGGGGPSPASHLPCYHPADLCRESPDGWGPALGSSGGGGAEKILVYSGPLPQTALAG